MDEWVWSNGGMILTGENWSTKMETSTSATFHNTYLTQTGQLMLITFNILFPVAEKTHCISITKNNGIIL